ncbi:MAG: ATP-binding protein [Desulfobulbaceae bacterium]|nr:ATP-binding protein [Desulfobulbaceae bacterium]
MLSAITLNNFKSYIEAKVQLGPLTVLIGANASGKSNAIEGLRLLSWLAQGQKLSSIQYSVQGSDKVVRGRVEDLGYLKSATFKLGCETDLPEWNQLSMELTNRSDGLHITAESISAPGQPVPLYNLDQSSEGVGSDARVAYNNFAKGPKKPHITCSDQLAVFTQLESPARFDAGHKKAQRVIPETVKLYQEWLGKILFLDPVPARMRDYSFTSDRLLLGDGTNLSSVLWALWGEDSKAEEVIFKNQRAAILEFIQSLPEQDIETLAFLTGPRGEVMVELVETFGGARRSYDASLLSDGTLRVLAIAAAMLSATEGSLVVIEEIDNGVHPSRAQHLLDQIQFVAKQRSLRVLLSTHNPAMLDALPDSAIPDVVFCYRDPQNGSSRIVRLQDVPDYPELIAQGTLGHLMTSGLMERFVKSHPGSDQRKKQALEWLHSMRTGGAV